MTKKKQITQADLHKIEKQVVREEMKEQGALDGRYRPKVIPDKKKYTRKKKRKDEANDQ